MRLSKKKTLVGMINCLNVTLSRNCWNFNWTPIQEVNYHISLCRNNSKTDEKIAVTSTLHFSNRNAIKVRCVNRQKKFLISFDDTANFSYLPNRILPHCKPIPVMKTGFSP